MATTTASKQEIELSSFLKDEVDSSPGVNIRCTLVGDPKCGKSSVLLSYLADSHPTQYSPTIFDSYSKRVRFRERTINLLLYDIGGDTELHQFGTQQGIGTDIFLVCFSIDDPSSYVNVSEKWRAEIEKNYLVSNYTADDPKSSLSKPIMILVGCKSDTRVLNPLFKDIRTLRRPSEPGKILQKAPSIKNTTISTPEGARLSNEIGAKKYFDCSAKSGSGIQEIFNEAIKLVLERREYANVHRLVLIPWPITLH